MNTNQGKNVVAIALGVIVIAIGMSMLLGNVFGLGLLLHWRALVAIFGILSAVVIIALGIFVIVRAQKISSGKVSEKRLFRSVSKKAIGGVCAGIAEYLNLDPIIIRVIAIILGLTSAYVSVPLYLILWAVVPPDTRKYNTWV